ncbi:hypothetical protein [Herbaspirillum sp. SJZ099]|uniref:hypothetical protein n=1 Tax=Herbaspirillum sp. SJZ099 TaxID=2572916 RepID=UPI0011A9C34E|nr:hypothetical protein [Herbaspirillum sp. SJZ099]TWC72021.1 hypothetical protein FB597_1011006 [Herbaspirillum sp. SJZ099]
MSSDDDAVALVRFLSVDRLATFQVITGSLSEAVSLHQQTMRIGAQVMAVTAVIEVALRNAVYARLEQYYGRPDWLRAPNIIPWASPELSKIRDAHKNARRAIYAKMNQADKRALDLAAFAGPVPEEYRTGGHRSHLRLVAERHKQIDVTMGQIVAQLTFFFWKRMYSKEYQNIFWQPLKTLFPARELKRPIIATQLEFLYQSRNRAAHHEPILGRRLQETLDAADFFLAHFDGKDQAGISHISKLLAEDLSQLKNMAIQLNQRIEEFKVRA